MTADWWARGLALAAGASSATNVVYTALTYRRVGPRVSVKTWRVALAHGTAEDPNVKQLQYSLRFANSGTTPVAVERIELLSYRREFSWNPRKFWRRYVEGPGSSISGLRQTAQTAPWSLDSAGEVYRFYVNKEALEGKGPHLGFSVLLTNGETVTSVPLKDHER